ncbi:MAG: hypothetical protein RRZ24_08950 [Clostridia bacterium]
MTKLSKREKMLLYILCAVVIVAGMVLLVIQPTLVRAGVLDETVLEQEITQNQMEQLIAESSHMRQGLEKSNAGIAEQATHFLPVMTSDELDRYITGLLQQNGLVAQSLQISEAITHQSDVEADVDANTDTGNGSPVLTYQVNVLASGTVSQFVNLTEYVGAADGIRIAKFTLHDQSTPLPTATPKPTKTPRATRTPRGMTPTPLQITTPIPVSNEPAYEANITFVVAEYDRDSGQNWVAARDTGTGIEETGTVE